jgi:hypothetical protein
MKQILFLLPIMLFAGLCADAQVTSVVSGKAFLEELRKKEKINPSKPSGLADFTEEITAPKETGKPDLEQIGKINWTEGVLQAKGKVFLNPKHVSDYGEEYAREMAKVGAETDARANLLAMVAEVKIYDTVRVVDKMLERKVTVSVLEGSIGWR